MMKNAKTIDMIAVILLLVGGLNWGLVGFFNIDLVSSVFPMGITRVIFCLVGLAAVYRVVCWARCKGK
jgi:uncharacterized membrane protein YuzA (DUF378 family)